MGHKFDTLELNLISLTFCSFDLDGVKQKKKKKGKYYPHRRRIAATLRATGTNIQFLLVNNHCAWLRETLSHTALWHLQELPDYNQMYNLAWEEGGKKKLAGPLLQPKQHQMFTIFHRRVKAFRLQHIRV